MNRPETSEKRGAPGKEQEPDIPKKRVKGVCKFNREWLTDPEFKRLVERK